MDYLYHKQPPLKGEADYGDEVVGVELEKDNREVTVLSLAQGLGLEFVPLGALHFLDGMDIARSGSVNRFLYQAAINEGVWQAARDRLWEGKIHIPTSAKAMKAKAGYIVSVQDSKRTWLDLDELTSFSWWFRFKQQAGEAWTAQDPWYRNEKAPTVEFKSDHTVLRHGDMSLPPAASINWRFVPRTGLRNGPYGSFLRVSIGGREVPTYIVSRHSSNWGFLLESCWTLYTSWEMPPRDGPDCDRLLLDDKLKVTMDDQWEEAMSFNTGLSFEIYDLAGLAGGDGDDDSLVDDVVDVLVEAMGDEDDVIEHEDQEHYHVHGHGLGLGGTGGELTGDTAEQPSHGSLHHLVNVSVAGSIPSAGQNF